MLNEQILKHKIAALGAVVAVTLVLSACGGHGHSTDHHSGDRGEGHHSGDKDSIGVPGAAVEVDRTIEVVMGDTMRFVPENINVESGQTIRFKLKNAGAVKHEMVIGKLEYLVEHSEMMKKFPNMEHEEPNMLLLDPAAEGELIWTFTKAGTVDFACLQPGHYDAGMKGVVSVGE